MTPDLKSDIGQCGVADQNGSPGPLFVNMADLHGEKVFFQGYCMG